MKLIRFGESGRERPGVIATDGTWLDAGAVTRDYDEEFFARGGIERLGRWLHSDAANASRVAPSTRLGPPIARPSKIVCIGLNFRDHAAETGAAIPAEPVVFLKSTTSLSGPNDDVIIPRNSQKTDWEVELAVVIGARTSYVDEGEAESRIVGYVLHNDYSEREFQLERGGQWVKGKSADTFAPLGPYLATSDEISDVNALGMWLRVNGEMMQCGSTRDMVFSAPKLVSYVSQFMTLLPGDVISTGTPAGVGLGHKPPRYLKAGDVVELGIDGLGSSRQRVRAYA